MTELEKKLLLTKDEYEYLLEVFERYYPLNKDQPEKQINYYFDTDDLEMTRKNITCRVRFKNGIYEGTMKQHFPETDRSTEKTIELYLDLERNEFTDMGLSLFGYMETERRIVMETSGCTVVLDKNKYLDTVDYELEIEYNLENEIDAYTIFQGVVSEIMRRRWLKEYREMYIQSKLTKSKSSRFFDRYCIEKQSHASESAANSSKNIDPDAYLKNYTAR